MQPGKETLASSFCKHAQCLKEISLESSFSQEIIYSPLWGLPHFPPPYITNDFPLLSSLFNLLIGEKVFRVVGWFVIVAVVISISFCHLSISVKEKCMPSSVGRSFKALFRMPGPRGSPFWVLVANYGVTSKVLLKSCDTNMYIATIKRKCKAERKEKSRIIRSHHD